MKNKIFYKKANKLENRSNYLKQKILRNMPDKEGYNKVYMPYGTYGKGFYYIKQDEK